VKSTTLRNLLIACGLITCNFLYAQENSPYSRYGLGDIAPSTNIVNRGMGGLSAAYADPFSINFTNPASYSQFLSYIEEKSKKVSSGRVLFDVGINYTSHTLREGILRKIYKQRYFVFLFASWCSCEEELGIKFRIAASNKNLL
jgi:hypothetical protein